MANWLKTGAEPEAVSARNAQVQVIVENTLVDIEERGDAAIRELSVKFDDWDREDYRLSQSEIDACLAQMTPQDIHDIEFAQAQVRNFAEVQRASMTDVEVETIAEIDRLLDVLPTADYARTSWETFGQVIVCEDHDEMLAVANDIASEHVQVMTDRDDWYLDNIVNYGALFLGSRTNVAFGDKAIGTNHTLPTKKAGRHTGGLWVGKFLKTHTYQKVQTDEASAKVGRYASRLCMLEGFAGDAEQANVRVRRFGGQNVPYAQPASPIEGKDKVAI